MKFKHGIRLVAILAIWLSATVPAFAVNPDEMLSDPVLEARARELSKGLRCVMCRNQSIDDSNAAIARDMRIFLRERLSAGDTDEQAMNYVVDRFGTYVLLKPPFRASTWLLWAGPIILLGATAFGFSRMFRRQLQAGTATIELTDEERATVARLLDEGPQT